MGRPVEQFDPFAPEAARSLSLDRTCRVLGMSRRTVYYWIKSGRLQTTRTHMGSQRVLTDSLRSMWFERF